MNCRSEIYSQASFNIAEIQVTWLARIVVLKSAVSLWFRGSCVDVEYVAVIYIVGDKRAIFRESGDALCACLMPREQHPPRFTPTHPLP